MVPLTGGRASVPAIKLAAGRDARPPEMKELLRTKSNRISQSRQLSAPSQIIQKGGVLLSEYLARVVT